MEGNITRIWTGRGAINQVLIDFNNDIDVNVRNLKKGLPEAIDIAFDSMFRKHDDMQPYFNNLYSVLDFVDAYFSAEIIDEVEANKFMSIVSGQLARSESELLCYYGLYSKAPHNLKEIIDNNGLLKNIDGKRIPSDVLNSYDPRAFM
ncbi:MAG: putative phage abortive infection protein [Chlorobi bacterium]|nr:putative phage abortive infection protein [Chlorobiota bacterium]